MNNPTKVRIGNEEYPINTDFRIALECNSIALNPDIGEYERALAVIYKLFGEKGLKDAKNHYKLLELGKKYLACGNEILDSKEQEMDMDFEQDMDYIEASFMSDYNIDLTSIKMHWWTFFNLLNGLSNSELGNCCILNRVRNLRNFNTSKIKDLKQKYEIERAKQRVALRHKQQKLTPKQEESLKKYYKLTGLYK